jgi:hypothetical protein
MIRVPKRERERERERMSYATGHNSFMIQYLLNIYTSCRFCRLCIINVWGEKVLEPTSRLVSGVQVVVVVPAVTVATFTK